MVNTLNKPYLTETRYPSWVFPILLFIVTVTSRIPFTSKLLYDQDSVQFALGMRQYDVYLHHPHPPGYFLYVMAGKLIHLFVQDANEALLLLSIAGSSLTVVALYYLGKLVFDRETGLWAAALAFSSPLLWYYGELALTYVVAACFNVWIAILCWTLIQKRHRSYFLSPILLGIAAGIRQDLAVFLFPLWFYSIRRLSWKQFLNVGVLLAITVAAWFIPMLLMSGGAERYFSAVNELWYFHNRTFAVWNAGLQSRVHFLLAFLGNSSYGLGIGTLIICLSAYAFVRTRGWRTASRENVIFFSLWLVPAFLFHIFVFMNPGQAGYSVFFLPALFVLFWPGLKYLFAQLVRVLPQPRLAPMAICRAAALVVVLTNALFFLLSGSVVSAKGIQRHDDDLSMVFRGIKKHFPAENTVIIDAQAYQLYSYRHIQYYLPSYRVYLTALSDHTTEPWHILSGYQGRTFITTTVDIAPEVRYIVYLTNPLNPTAKAFPSDKFHRLRLDERNTLFYTDTR